jgi:two-component system, NarL family, response regulator LiaR
MMFAQGMIAMSIRVLIADDHEVVRKGLKMFLGMDEGIEIIGEAATGKQALQLAHELSPDVILMDLMMPEMDGITAIGHVRRELPDIEIVAVTSILENNSVISAVRAGAIGYMLKDSSSDELIGAIKAAANGQVRLSPKAAALLMKEVRAPENPEPLSNRENEVLILVARGKSNKEIALELYIGEKTVKTHVSNILSKLNVSSRTQAALHAARVGLVKIDD